MNKYNVRTTTVREYAGGSSVGGILRKTGTSHSSANSSGQSNNTNTSGDGRQIELLVFGYACKVFRDDDKARDIDQGKHLIPWMGDANLKIDRYDVRGALCDLAPHEAPPGGYGNRLDYLTADEQRAEQLCEEERYLYLYNNEEEHILQQEEDLKRLKQESEGGNFSQVGYRYGANADITTALTAGTEGATDVADEQPFVLPAKLVVPAHLQLPETMKQHAIIEKTARFIASQGVQMEILLKAKQSNNVQFEFLTQNSVLNAYYKHLVELIKQGTYPAEQYQVEQLLESSHKPSTETDSASEANGAAVAAVSLNSKKPVITVPTIKYKPSANCAYTQLISKIRGVPLQTVIDEDANSNNSGINSPTTSIKSSNSGEFTPVLLQYNGSTFTHADDGDADASNTCSLSNGGTNDANNADSADGAAKVEVFKNTSALALAQNYCTDTDESENDEEQTPVEPVLNFPIPEDNLRHIIDKTATYVIKNGRQFEETLRAKSVERFTFLLPDNEYYPYYMYKITDDPNAASKEQKTRKAAAVAAALLSKKGLTAGAATATATATGAAAAVDKQMTPVSFSIKPKDEHPPLQPALPQEPSDDETEQDAEANGNVNGAVSNVDRQVPERVQKAIQLVEAQLLARNGVTTPQQPESRSPEHSRQKEIKKAEEKFKDKLAQIAREKLGGLITKEKQLQLERKRKAMAFLNQIKSGEGATAKVQIAIDGAAGESNTNTDNTQKTLTRQTAAREKINCKDDDSDVSSVRSIPITSYGPEDDDEPDELQNEQIINKKETPITQISKESTTRAPTVLLSDDDDVQLVGETSPPLNDAHMKRALKKHSSSSKKVKYAKQIEADSGCQRSRHKAKKMPKDSQAERKHSRYRESKRTHTRTRTRSRSCTTTSSSEDSVSDSETSTSSTSTSTDDTSSDSDASTNALRSRRAKKSSRTRHKTSSHKKTTTLFKKKRRARSRSRSHDEVRRHHKKSSRYAEEEAALAYMRQRDNDRKRATMTTSKQKQRQSNDRHRKSRSRSRSTNSQASKRSKRSSSCYAR